MAGTVAVMNDRNGVRSSETQTNVYKTEKRVPCKLMETCSGDEDERRKGKQRLDGEKPLSRGGQHVFRKWHFA